MIKLKKSTLLLALAINCLFLFASLILFHPHFEVVDDQFMAALAEGAYGSRSSILVFINCIYGKLLNVLYSLYAGIRWYSVLQFLFLFMSFTSITYVLMKLAGNRLGGLLGTFLLLCFSYEGYVYIQYTKTSGYMVAAGYLLMFYMLLPASQCSEGKEISSSKPALQKESILGIVLGGLLIFIGALLRKESFFAISLFMLGIGLYEVFKIIKNTERSALIKTLLRYAAPFAVVIILVFAANLYHSKTVENSPEWNTYWDYYQHVTQLVDYNKLNWEGYEDAYSALNVSENDVLLYKSWSFGDPEIFTVDFMNELLKVPAKRAVNIDLVKAAVSEHYSILFAPNSMTYGCILLLCIFILCCIKRRKFDFIAGYAIMVLIGVHAYFFYVERLHHRTIVLFWFAAFLMIVYSICRSKNTPLVCTSICNKVSVLVCFCLFTYMGCWIVDMESFQEQRRELQSNVEAFYQSVSKDKDHLYITDNATDLSTYSYQVFRPYPEGYLDNLAYFGYWLSGSPIEKDILNRYGVDNPYTAALEQDNVYIVDNYLIDEKLQYIQEHYDADAEIEFVEERFGFMVYQIKN